VLVAFRRAANPPAVVISTDQVADLLAFKQALMKLASSETPTTISMVELGGIELEDLDELLLVRTANSKGPRRPTVEFITDEHGTTVMWWGRGDDWIGAAKLVDGVIESQQPGHQYLTGYLSVDPMQIVVSFRSEGRH
jgi:hypothetical protein